MSAPIPEDLARATMTERALRRSRAIDLARAYQSAAAAANPHQLRETGMSLEVGERVRMHMPPERALELSLLTEAADYRKIHRQRRGNR